MAKVRTKKKATRKVGRKAAARVRARREAEEVGAKVDEYGRLADRVAEVAADMKRMGELEKGLKEVADAMEPADEAVELRGEEFSLAFAAKGDVRSVKDPKAAFEALEEAAGDEVYSLIGLPLGKLDDYLTKRERDALLEIRENVASRRRLKLERLR